MIVCTNCKALNSGVRTRCTKCGYAVHPVELEAKNLFMENYIVQFMACHDAAHFCFNQDKVSYPCNYALAKREAERAWIEYEKGLKDDSRRA